MKKLLTGWHYTSAENWESISREGLKPRPTKNVDLRLEGIKTCVCVFRPTLSGVCHAGQVMERATALGSWRIVLLEVQYPEASLAQSEQPSITGFWHSGTLSHTYGLGLAYHHNVAMDVLIKPVPTRNIKFLAEYNLLKLIKEPTCLGG